MRVVINHLTRMRRGYICVAGMNLDDGKHVRLMPRGTDLRYPDLSAHGGLFEIGAVLDIGRAVSKAQSPEMEDHEFHRRYSRRLPGLQAERFWQQMKTVSKPTLVEIFGHDLHPVGQDRAAVEPGHGQSSLGVLSVSVNKPELMIVPNKPRDQIRIKLRTGRFPLNVSVTDIRLYQADHVTPDPAAVEAVQLKMASANEVLLGVGLTRAYADWLSDQPPRHWLQVNNLHFEDDPFWNLSPAPLPALV